jgi:hypothetical protein
VRDEGGGRGQLTELPRDDLALPQKPLALLPRLPEEMNLTSYL